jgi:hypothetical protein
MGMGADLTPEELAKIIEKLEASGYVIKRKGGAYLKKTFDIDQDLWSQVDALRKQLNITVREVFSEALILWLDRRKTPR